jgi:hypothetical protein
MKNFLLILVTLSLYTPVFSQNSPVKQDKDWSIRANWNYQFYSFSGRRTNSSAIGGILEKRINYEATLGLSLNYLTRMEDAELQRNNLEAYNEVFYISPFVRKYFHKALEGPYSAFSVGLGIPKERGTQWDAGGQLGYLIVGDKIAIDLMIQMGFGSYRHYEDYYNPNGKLQGNYFVVDYGFYFRPGISIGFAM